MYDLTESVYLNKGGEVVKQPSQTESEQHPRQNYSTIIKESPEETV